MNYDSQEAKTLLHAFHCGCMLRIILLRKLLIQSENTAAARLTLQLYGERVSKTHIYTSSRPAVTLAFIHVSGHLMYLSAIFTVHLALGYINHIVDV